LNFSLLYRVAAALLQLSLPARSIYSAHFRFLMRISGWFWRRANFFLPFSDFFWFHQTPGSLFPIYLDCTVLFSIVLDFWFVVGVN